MKRKHLFKEILYTTCVFLFLLDSPQNGVVSWQGNTYWNQRYQAKDANWVEYTTGKDWINSKISLSSLFCNTEWANARL